MPRRGGTTHSRIPVASAARMLSFFLLCSVCALSAGQRNYFTISRTSSRNRLLSDEGDSMLDSLQRGHEGLLAQLEHLSNAIKEDELKLNNVFYKLGRHDTDISATTSQQMSLQNTARKLENKLNRQSFNMDFLRRHVSELKKGVDTSTTTASTVSALQLTVDSLQKALAQALFRTEQLENKTRLMERDLLTNHADIDENNIYYASRSPKTTYYYLDSEALEGVCDEANGWVSVSNGGCWWVSSSTASFPQAVAGCAKQGGVLAQLPMDDRDWPLQVKRKFEDSDAQTLHWTSGTSVFDKKTWEYLFSGSAIPNEHWADGFPPTSSVSRHCAAMSRTGLTAVSCAMRNAFVCEKL